MKTPDPSIEPMANGVPPSAASHVEHCDYETNRLAIRVFAPSRVE